MARGAPDDSNIIKTGAVYRLDDMAELAARLGTIYNYHRFGDVVFLEDFEKGAAKWVLTAYGAGSTVTITSDKALSGNQCIYLHAQAGLGPRAMISKALALPISKRLGFSFAFNLGDDFVYFGANVLYYTGTRLYEFEIDYDWATGYLKYYTVGSVMQNFLYVGELSRDHKLFHIVKITFDAETGDYNTLFIDQLSADMTALNCGYVADTTNPHLELLIASLALSDASSDMYVDDVILSQNEFEG